MRMTYFEICAVEVSKSAVNINRDKWAVARQKKFSLYVPGDAFLPALRLGVADKNSTGTEIIIRHDCDLRTRMEDD